MRSVHSGAVRSAGGETAAVLQNLQEGGDGENITLTMAMRLGAECKSDWWSGEEGRKTQVVWGGREQGV